MCGSGAKENQPCSSTSARRGGLPSACISTSPARAGTTCPCRPARAICTCTVASRKAKVSSRIAARSARVAPAKADGSATES